MVGAFRLALRSKIALAHVEVSCPLNPATDSNTWRSSSVNLIRSIFVLRSESAFVGLAITISVATKFFNCKP
jgi:hypothetical protein